MNKLTDKWYLLPIILVVFMLIGKQSKAQDTTQVKALLEAYGVNHVDIVLRQSILETGWYKCTNCSMKYNNIFGFMTKDGYIKFDRWEDSVKYYKMWQERLSGVDQSNYYLFLQRVGYATDPTYIDKLKKLY